MTELVSLREYARRRGVSAMAVSKAAKAGRITLVDGKVDVATADRDWPSNTNPGQMAFKPAPPAVAAEGQGTQEPGDDEGQATQTEEEKKAQTSTGQYGQARAVREMYNARLAKIEFEKETGILVNADAVRVAAFNAARTARDSLLSMPDRLSPVLAGESNQFEVHRLLSEEIRRVCDELAAAKPF
jgi:hypothetical protein